MLYGERNDWNTDEGHKKVAGFNIGDDVVFMERQSHDQISWGGNDNPNKVLEVGESYKVKNIEVHSCRTFIELEGIEGCFNHATFCKKGEEENYFSCFVKGYEPVNDDGYVAYELEKIKNNDERLKEKDL
jgi:hypothetical protein